MNAEIPLASEPTSAPASVDPSGDRGFLDRLSALTDQDFQQRLVVAFEALGYTVDWFEYPMPHAVCPEEIADISRWLTLCFQSSE